MSNNFMNKMHTITNQIHSCEKDNGSLSLEVSISPQLYGKRSTFQTQTKKENNILQKQVDLQIAFTQVLQEENVFPQSVGASVDHHFLKLGPNEGLGFTSSSNLFSISTAKNYCFEQTDDMSLASIKIGKAFSVAKKKVKSFSPQRENDGNAENNLNCFLCNVNFSSMELLQEHKTEDKFICRVCTKEFISHVELETHALDHKIYTCQVCSRQFFCKGDLLKHKQMHNITKYQCEFCVKTFSKFNFLQKHKAVVHEGNVNKHKCIVCGKSYSGLPQLKDHQKKIHVTYENIKCNMCPRVYLGPDNLKAHIRSIHLYSEENTPVSCTKCSKVLASPKWLSKHMETHDTTEMSCGNCGKMAKNINALRRHMTLYHSGKIKKNCDICNEQFDDPIMFRNHKRLHKYRIQNHVYCEICGKKFKNPRILKNHMAVHSDARPFVCEVCGASFKFSVPLRNHRKVHNAIGEYKCKHCDKLFKWKQTFDKHLMKCEAGENHV